MSLSDFWMCALLLMEWDSFLFSIDGKHEMPLTWLIGGVVEPQRVSAAYS